jgi:hypothetical protein
MKKILLATAFMTLSLNSCRSENNEPQTETQVTISQQIVGTWTITKKETNGVNIPPSSLCPNHGNFVFTTDKKLTENYNSNNGGSCSTDTDLSTYTIDENSKKITTKNSQNDVLIYNISTLTDNQLILINTEGSDTIKYTFSK